MKNKTIPFSLLTLLIASLASCGGSNEPSKKPTVEKHDVKAAPVYVLDPEGEGEKKFVPDESGKVIKYHFFNNSIIPYFELVDFMNNYTGGNPFSTSSSYRDKEEPVITYTQESGGFKIKINNKNVDTYLFLDVDQQKLTYHNFTYYFLSSPYDKYPFESFFSAGKPYFKDNNFSFEVIKEGNPTFTIDLSKYNMKIYEYENKCYVSNFLCYNAVWPMFLGNPTQYFYNGINAYDYHSDLFTQKDLDLYAYIRKNSPICASDEYLRYNYDYLALMYDNFFGLDKRTSVFTGEEHIYFKDGAYKALEPFKDKLLSKDLNVSNNAMIEFYNKEVNDGGHSSYSSANILTSSNKHPEYTGDFVKIQNWSLNLDAARNDAKLSPKLVNKEFAGYYKEYDNDVAFITFDEFDNEGKKVYTKDDLVETEYGKITATLFGYADKQIRANSIKNVVIDLSCNGGGSGDAVMFIMSWLTGKGGTMTLRNPKDGTHIKVTGYADINFDGVYDSKDVIPSDVNVYAIISHGTFSSANLLSVLLKEHTNTKFIGTRTGGGSCNASGFSTPLNAQPRISGLAQLGLNSSTKDNFVSDEAGVVADFYKLSNDIKDVAQFFDRTAIINKIKGK